MSKQTILRLSNPSTMAVFVDFELLQRWEILRRSTAERSAAEFAAACGVGLGPAQRSLDRLIEAGFVVRVPAGRARRYIAYRSVAAEVLIAWDPSSPEQRGAVRRHHLAMRALSRAIIDRHLVPELETATPKPCFHGYATVMLTRQEVDQVQRALRAACEVLDRADMRAEERARGAYSGDISPEAEQPYHFAVEHRALAYPESPIPHYELWDEGSVPRELERASKAASQVLTPREFEIAKRLASGDTRPIIAKALGITPNTVATVCKRIHAKLGVHSRAQLTARLKGV